MPEQSRRILILVEGAKTETTLMKHLFKVYGIDAMYEIVPYRTNIYSLYNEMFADKDPSSFDLLQVLREREQNEAQRAVFNEVFTDILLIFDFEPHAPDFEVDKILQMAEYFTESTDMGKLYLNYPMVEAFYHMSSIPDPQFDSYYASVQELITHAYKSRVNQENRNRDYKKFAVTREECNIVIRQHMGKAYWLFGCEPYDDSIPEQLKILAAQLELLIHEQKISVICTCCYFIPEYNSSLLS